jgi:DNA-binding LacI/PurR family transcriptional regulator
VNKTKYSTIADQLELNINSGFFKEKLPSVRVLATDFNVSTRTLNKALKVLVEKGLIIPNGYQGNLISTKTIIRAKTKIVALFCDTGSHDPLNDPLLNELRIRVEEDGYKLLFMNVPDPNIFDDEKFWSSNWVDGYIFAYSSIKRTIARKLRSHSVPFVVANRVEPDFGANWVDFDLSKRLQVQIEALINNGRKKIMFAYSGIGLDSYVDYIQQECANVLKKYVKCCSGTIFYFAGNDIAANTLQCAEKFIEHRFDGLITTGLDPILLEAELAKANFSCGDDYTMIHRSSKPDAVFDRFPYIVVPYKQLADATWELFIKVVDNPGLQAQQILVEEEFHFDKISQKIDKTTEAEAKYHQAAYAVA